MAKKVEIKQQEYDSGIFSYLKNQNIKDPLYLLNAAKERIGNIKKIIT